MKVKTIEQYKILEYIKENFIITDVEVEESDECTLKVTDKNGDVALFKYKDGKVFIIYLT